MAEEKIYTVPLRRGFMKAPNYDRTRKAIVVLKEFLRKHTKKDVKIGRYLNLEMWKHGRKNPPPRIKVRVEEEKERVIAELVNAPRDVKEKKDDTVAIKKPKFLESKEKKSEDASEKIIDEKKEETKKAIEDISKNKKEFKQSGIVEKEHKHRKEEKVIGETGKTKSRTS